MDRATKHRVNSARVAIRNQIPFFKGQFGVVPSEWKADDTRVTFADFAISENIFKDLNRSFPEDNFCSEESSSLDAVMPLKGRYTWVLDPIDGTNNYAIGIPFSAISLAILKEGKPVYGLVYDFSRDAIIEGGRQFGVLENGRRLQIHTPELDSKSSLIAIHFPLPPGKEAMLWPLMTTYRVRSMGSAALHMVYTGLGYFDGVVDFKVKIWDIAAAIAILEGVQRPIHFLSDPPFPMESFHVSGPFLQYYAGTEEFCRYFKKLLGDSGHGKAD